ncbi:MAG: SusC/RagA family TonB-linked outer membrane protein [Candidatus Curtissbacteria bacterium]
MKKRLLLLMSMLMVFNISLFSQARTITGTVTSAEDDSSLVGVTVVVKGTTIGVITDNDGEFTIMVPGETATLVFTFMGLKAKEIEVSANRTNYDVVLEPSILSLDEVIVTALGISRKKETLGYAVQDVGGEELAEVKPANIVNALSGKIAGVQITNATGAPGGASRIVIRGNGSFTDSEPLWVVDGTPFINFSADNGPMSGADFGNGALDIDPSNIESISVLKGANAAALYGSRAANGVILVTTKRGKSSKGFGVEISSAITVDAFPYLPYYQNEYGAGAVGSEYDWNKYNADKGTNLTYQQYAEQFGYNFVNGAGGGVNDNTPSSWGPRLDAGLILDQFTGDDQPWVSRPNNVRDFYETGITTDNSVALSNAGEFGSVRAYFNDNNIKGTLPNTDYRKNTFGFNSDLILHERLKFSTNLNYVINKSDNLPAQGYYGDAPNSPQTAVTFMPRQVDIKPLKENWNTITEHGYPYSFGVGETPNPYLAARNTNSRTRNRIYGNVVLDFKLTDWLTLRGRAGTDQFSENRKSIILALTYRATDGSGLKGTFDEQNLTGEETNFDFLAMFDKSFGDFRVDGTLGANRMSSKRRNNSIYANDLVTPDLFTIGNAKGVQGVSQFESEKQIHGVYGDINASYKDYLFLSVTARNDWSSTLPKSEWSYFYPSFSLGFVFTDALKISSDVFSFGKIRGGWASVGRDTNPYNIHPTYSPVGPLWEGNGVYSLPGTLPNRLLKPETSKSVEIGGNFRFFNNRVELDISYYDVKNQDQILNVAVSQASGYNAVTINAGEIQNTGVEVMLNTTPIRTSNFSWDLDFNWAKNNNMVNSLYGDLETYRMSSMWAASIQSRPGQPFGTIIGNAYQRDVDGNILVNNAGRVLRINNQELGNITPDWVGGMTNTVRYKNISLRVLLDAKMGGDFVAGSIRWGGSGGALAFTAADNIRETGAIWDAVTASGGEPNTKRISGQQYIGDYSGTVENWVIDGSYVKLREVSLGYTFPKVGNLGIRLSLIGRNLSILYRHESNPYGLDPETGSGSGIAGLGYEQMQIPSARNIGARVTITF